MEMDRQTMIVVFGAIIAFTLFGSFYLSSPPARDDNRPTYAQDDVRYQLQQQADKDKRNGKKSAPVQETSSSGGDSGSDDESAEEPPAEEPEAEEPSIE